MERTNAYTRVPSSVLSTLRERLDAIIVDTDSSPEVNERKKRIKRRVVALEMVLNDYNSLLLAHAAHEHLRKLSETDGAETMGELLTAMHLSGRPSSEAEAAMDTEEATGEEEMANEEALPKGAKQGSNARRATALYSGVELDHEQAFSHNWEASKQSLQADYCSPESFRVIVDCIRHQDAWEHREVGRVT